MGDEHGPERRIEMSERHQKIVAHFSTAMMVLFGLVAAAIVLPEVVYKVGNAFGYIGAVQGCPELWGLGTSLVYGVAAALASAGFAAGAPASAGNRLLNWVAERLPGD